MITLGRVGILALALAVPAVAVAQGYREDMPPVGLRPGLPEVNAPRPAENPDAGNIRTSETFRRWYARSKRPSMMVFWNREQTDETTTQYTDVTTTREEVRSSGSRLGNNNTFAQKHETYDSKVGTTETSKRATTGGKFAPMDTLMSAQLEAAFQSAWLQTGVELVDRTAIMRKMSVVANKDDRSDGQFMEAVAMEQGVDYLIEVMPLAQGASPTGLVFMVRVKHLPSATMVAQFNTSAQPAAGPERIVAVAGGFEKRRENRTSPETIGAELAFQTMSRFR